LRRAIEHYLEDPLAEKLLHGEFAVQQLPAQNAIRSRYQIPQPEASGPRGTAVRPRHGLV
jgi:hypothetical protein